MQLTPALEHSTIVFKQKGYAWLHISSDTHTSPLVCDSPKYIMTVPGSLSRMVSRFPTDTVWGGKLRNPFSTLIDIFTHYQYTWIKE